mmetsp:Transcript_113111/g.320108  ORF Transcript_113111/g.320108 Transcript_113111/m.320108 type:complete len:216 (+) Transcript_113111:221-868(+)
MREPLKPHNFSSWSWRRVARGSGADPKCAWRLLPRRPPANRQRRRVETSVSVYTCRSQCVPAMWFSPYPTRSCFPQPAMRSCSVLPPARARTTSQVRPLGVTTPTTQPSWRCRPRCSGSERGRVQRCSGRTLTASHGPWSTARRTWPPCRRASSGSSRPRGTARRCGPSGGSWLSWHGRSRRRRSQTGAGPPASCGPAPSPIRCWGAPCCRCWTS